MGTLFCRKDRVKLQNEDPIDLAFFLDSDSVFYN